MNILIVEDDSAIVRSLERILGAYGHRTFSADNGEDAIPLATGEAVEFVILDISLPGIDGYEVLRRIREAKPRLPVLMLTARDELENKIVAFKTGADDYLTKPFAFEELLARIDALWRRVEQTGPTFLEIGDLHLDLLTREVWRGDKEIDLSTREFALLEYLMRHQGQTLSRQKILSDIWHYDFDPGSNVIDVYVRYLRNKIDCPGNPSLITAIRGVGYRFDPPTPA